MFSSSQCFSRCVRRSSSGVSCRIHKLITPNLLFNPRSYTFLTLLTMTWYKCLAIVSILCYLPMVGIEPETARWFHLEARYNQTPISVVPWVLLDNPGGNIGTYKPRVSINPWVILTTIHLYTRSAQQVIVAQYIYCFFKTNILPYLLF